jgi:hypothetical protein
LHYDRGAHARPCAPRLRGLHAPSPVRLVSADEWPPCLILTLFDRVAELDEVAALRAGSRVGATPRFAAYIEHSGPGLTGRSIQVSMVP